jgi:hypothetical protein
MRIAIALLVALLAGCGNQEPPPEPRQNVFEPLTVTLDRAEGVQQTLDGQAAERRRRLEEAER